MKPFNFIMKKEEITGTESVKPCEVYIKEEPIEENKPTDFAQPTDDDDIKIKKEEEFIISNRNEANVPVKFDYPVDPMIELKIQNSTKVKNTEFKLHQCPNCKYKAINASNLKRHIKSRHCSYCDYKTPLRSYDLKNHIKTHHTAGRPHRCLQCDYRADTDINLEFHTWEFHSGGKPHHCPHCEFKGDQVFELSSHIKENHSGEKPHHCPNCDYKSLHTNNLKIHIMAHHGGEKIYKCSRCNYKTFRAYAIKYHKLTHHTGEN